MTYKIIYKRYIPLRLSSIIYIGFSCLMIYFLIDIWIYFLSNDIQVETGIIALSLLAIGLLIKGISGKSIEEIKFHIETSSIELLEQSLFRNQNHYIILKELSVELKTTDNKKSKLLPKIKLVICDKVQGSHEINSTIFGLNNDKIRKAYYLLKKTKELRLSNQAPC